jgi:hypothetical protein
LAWGDKALQFVATAVDFIVIGGAKNVAWGYFPIFVVNET